ncbi:carbohydrate ABC transporter permease [Acuticoccus mangrovi]|uniref:Carbohydrate ABC transporter permease n=1 Tax=Acuticoccus mangrovi TaxID=2796142 RepID=A0A934MDU0_9HYPH|nr:carbohydrate ABC transporter permease [Acuticoccus mangrovi]MBJ3776742.1 carbohydrate ABC transporter permease [Acuticoccus mangrovi]
MNATVTAPLPAPKTKPKRRYSPTFTLLVICYAILILFPVFWMWLLAFKPETVMFARPTVWLFEPTLDHFRYLIDNGFHHYLINSIIVSGLSTLLVIVLGTPAAYAFARYKMKGRDDLFLFVLATRMAPPVCLVIPFYLIYSKLGMLDTYAGLVIVYLTFNLSFYVWVLSSFCRDLPLELEEAAMTDGYSRLGAFLKVLLPLLRPGITATAVLCFIFAWNEFMYAFLLGGQNVKTLPVAIPSLITTQGVRWGEMAIIGMVGTIPVMIVVFVLQRHIVRGLTMGAVKG